MNTALITNDAVVFGVLMAVLAFIFTTSHSQRTGWQRFYRVVPSLFVAYFVPALLSTFSLIDGDASNLYFVASRYLLPTALVLLTLSVDLPSIMRLGPKALIMFLAGTVGIVVGGPLAMLLVGWFDPSIVGGTGPDAVWRGLATVAGSWIGGGANQTAMKEIFEVSDDLFSAMIAVDVIIANIWLAVLLYLIGRAPELDAKIGADTSAIDEVRRRVEAHQAKHLWIPSLTDSIQLLAVGFGATAVSHFLADLIAPWIATNLPGLAVYSLTSQFFWLVVIATTLGVVLSNTGARRLEGAGAARVGTLFIWVLVVTIGMQMNLLAVFDNPGLFVVGAVWMIIHAAIMLGVARVIRAPIFFVAVGSQANVGGAASAPIVASAVHPSLAPVGALLAVLGYAVGTYGAYLSAQLMRAVAAAG